LTTAVNPYPPHLTQALIYLFEGVLNGVTLLREQMRSEFALTQERVKHFQALGAALQEELLTLSRGPGQEVQPGLPFDNSLLGNVVTLVTDLQYEDIIRQILGHIEQTAKDILHELQLAATAGKRKAKRKAGEYTWLLGIVDVIQLVTALFGLAQKEHQLAIQNLQSKLSSLQDHALYLLDKGHEYFLAHSGQHEASASKAALVIRLSYELTAQANAVFEGLGQWFSFDEVLRILFHYFQQSVQQLTELPVTGKPLPGEALGKLLERCTMQSERLIYQQLFQPDLECYSLSQNGNIEMF
jgi:hypothetical protein